MSVLFQGVYADPGDPLFVPYAAAISTASLLQNNINVSSIVTNHITLDQVNMDSAVLNSVPTLLLNGQPVATGTSFTSSVTSWASFPALSTINYNVAGSGAGVINMTNVNALTNVSSATATFGTLSTIGLGSIGGSIYPSAPQYSEIVSMRQTVSNIQNKTSARLDFSAQANGYYLVTTNLDSADEDPFSCSFVIWKTYADIWSPSRYLCTKSAERCNLFI